MDNLNDLWVGLYWYIVVWVVDARVIESLIDFVVVCEVDEDVGSDKVDLS